MNKSEEVGNTQSSETNTRKKKAMNLQRCALQAVDSSLQHRVNHCGNMPNFFYTV